MGRKLHLVSCSMLLAACCLQIEAQLVLQLVACAACCFDLTFGV